MRLLLSLLLLVLLLLLLLLSLLLLLTLCFSFVSYILTGFSCGAEATAFSILPVYFNKYYDISNSIAHAGLSVGVMVMPIVTQLFLDSFGWRGTMLILAALNTHIVISGALLRPLQKHQSDSTKSDNQLNHTKGANNINGNSKSSKEHFQITEALVHTFDLTLFTNAECVSLLVAGIGYGYYYTGWLIYLVPHAEDLGFSPYAASALATAGGVGNLVGSCAFPLVAKVLSSKAMLIIFHFIAFVSLAADPILSIGPFYIGLMSAAFVLNFAFATWGCAYNKESNKILDVSRMHSFLNWSYVTYGIGSILSGFVSGLLISLVVLDRADRRFGRLT